MKTELSHPTQELKVTGPVRSIRVQGMTCAHCAHTVEKALTALPGIREASANVAAGRVSLVTSGSLDTQAIQRVVEAAGYVYAEESGAGSTDHIADAKSHARKELHLFIWSLLWTLPVLVIHFGGYAHASWAPWVALIAASVLQPTSAITYYRGAIRNLKQRSMGMDLLVSLGIAGGYVYAVLATILPDLDPHQAMPFYEASTLLICFIRIGKWIELRSRAKAAEAMGALLSLQPEQARQLRDDGSEITLAASDVAKGMKLVVLPGERIPADAEVLEGQSSCDESIVTGEADPRGVDKGDSVISGALNLEGRLVLRVTREAGDSTLARISDMIVNANASKAPIQRTADRIANIFVPVVVGIALLSGIYWSLIDPQPASRVLLHVIGVLVIACPCALALAVPAAIMIGSRSALQRGILVKHGAALEELSHLDHIVFDKTGTLTRDLPEVVGVALSDGVKSADLAVVVLPLVGASHHPLSRAVLAWARGQNMEGRKVFASQEVRGKGLRGTSTEGRELRLASRAYALESGIDEAALRALEDALPADASHSFVLEGGRLLGALAVRAALREGAAAIIRELQRSGVALTIASGDRPEVVTALGRELGIADARGAMHPEDKLALVQELQAQGKRVALVGDGVNDAPAMAQANVGVAMGSATDFARQACDIVVLVGGIQGVARAIDLSRRTRRAIHQNLALSLVYNVIGIPLAAGLGTLITPGMIIPPSYAALAMVFSDVSLAANSARLMRELKRTE